MAEGSSGPITVMLVGKTGSGKSSLANALCNLNDQSSGFVFEVAEGHGRGRLTVDPQTHTAKVDGVKLRVIDTPGFFDSEQSVNARWLDILKAVSLAGNSLDVIILVVSIHQIGAGVDCFKIVKDHMLEYMIDRLIIVFTFAGNVDESIRQKYKHQFNEDVQCGTLGASYAFSDQKDEKEPLARSISEILSHLKRIKQSNPAQLEKRAFRRHTETVVRNGVEAMEPAGELTYAMYCNRMKIDQELLPLFIPQATIDGILDERNGKERGERRVLAYQFPYNIRDIVIVVLFAVLVYVLFVK